ncbi:MAG: polysaccharide deacetylase family protein [Clostridium sp.]
MSKFKILMYHEIIKKEDYNKDNNFNIKVKQNYDDILPHVLFTYLEDFKAQMKYLFENGYKTLTLKEVHNFYYNGGEIPEKSVLLTFDDMYLSIYEYGYQILKEYGFNAVGFVTLDWLFRDKVSYDKSKSVCMDIETLKKMSDVFEFANHTNKMHTRIIEDGKMITKLQQVSKEEFLEDLKICEDFVDYKGAFAYPFGGYIEENLNWLKESNYKLAFTSEMGWNDENTKPLLLHRDAVILGTGLEKFKTLLK